MKETAYWTWFIISGIALFFLVGLHMVIMHLDGLLGLYNPAGPSSVAWENVRFRSTSLFFTVTYVIILGAALYHGFYGLRTIIFELGPKKSFQRPLAIFFWIIGICLFMFGSIAAVAAKAVNITP